MSDELLLRAIRWLDSWKAFDTDGPETIPRITPQQRRELAASLGALLQGASRPNWDAMTAEEIAAVIESAPVVLGEWKDTARGGAERLSRGCVRGGASIWPAAWPDDGTGWWWRMHGVGPPPSGGNASTRKAAMAAADAAARERGWRLMGGE